MPNEPTIGQRLGALAGKVVVVMATVFLIFAIKPLRQRLTGIE